MKTVDKTILQNRETLRRIYKRYTPQLFVTGPFHNDQGERHKSDLLPDEDDAEVDEMETYEYEYDDIETYKRMKALKTIALSDKFKPGDLIMTLYISRNACGCIGFVRFPHNKALPFYKVFPIFDGAEDGCPLIIFPYEWISPRLEVIVNKFPRNFGYPVPFGFERRVSPKSRFSFFQFGSKRDRENELWVKYERENPDDHLPEKIDYDSSNVKELPMWRNDLNADKDYIAEREVQISKSASVISKAYLERIYNPDHPFAKNIASAKAREHSMKGGLKKERVKVPKEPKVISQVPKPKATVQKTKVKETKVLNNEPKAPKRKRTAPKPEPNAQHTKSKPK